LLEKISAKYQNEFCFDYYGDGGIGNYIKMVHNGIEYGVMQLISETYNILKNHYELSNVEISKILEKWNKGKLDSYLLSITIKILNKKDTNSGVCLIDMMKDKVDSKGTGHMTVIDALEKKIPINIIFSALEFRNLSIFRKNISSSPCPSYKKILITDNIINKLENALYFSIILTFFQGINLIYYHNLEVNNDKLNLIKLLKVWRNGCIIKCNIINEIIDYIDKNKYEINEFVFFIKEKHNIYYNDLFDVINITKEPILTYSNVLQFCNIIFSKKLQSAPLLQAMRDCFGGHMFELEDYNEKIHADWLE
jgi:6-phosphogluconate dehydrogenase